MIMPKMSYSLNDKQSEYPFFGMEAAQKIAIQLILGLKAIHDTGYVHCDLKPQNIMILEEGF
jgi:serine/threonine protein kinase